MRNDIAIDGPAGAGKSTVAKMTAKALGFVYVDTGAMYRAIAVHLLRQGVSAEDTEAVRAALTDVSVGIAYEDGAQKVFLNGEDVTPFLRTEETGNMASASSALPCVRAKLLDLQRHLAETTDVVMDGRDIGTVVLPGAFLKIFLTASAEKRAERRVLELRGKGLDADPAKVLADIKERDERDMTRETAPLRQAEDAVLVDSSEISAEEVTARILALFREKKEKA